MDIQALRDFWDKRGLTGQQIDTAVRQHERMLFYWTFTGKDNITDTERDAYTHFRKVREILNEANKYVRYCQMFTNPLPEMLALILPELNAAAHAIDKNVTIEMASKSSQEDVSEYLKGLKLEHFFSEKYLYTTFINPSGVVIVDTNDNGDPYFWEPNISDIVGVKLNAKGLFELFAVKSEDRILVYDTEYYRVFDSQDSKLLNPLLESAHGLGYCPVTFLWNSPLITDNYFPRRTPAVACENSIDKFIFHEGGREYYELYAKYDIVSRLAEKCTVTHRGQTCNGAYFEWHDEQSGEWLKEPCKCRNSKFLGPGSELQITLPESISGQSTAGGLPEIVRFTGAEVGKLQYNADRSAEYEDRLYNILTGGNPEAINNKAVNDKQVSGVFEQKKKIIGMYARQMERVHKFIAETVARLRYTDFVNMICDYGTVFNIETKEYLSQAYRDAKESTAGTAKLIALKEQIINSEAKTAGEAERLKLISLLNEFPDLATPDLMELRKLDAISNETLTYHLQLPYLVQRYEREIGQITGKETIESIKSILLSYLTIYEDEQSESDDRSNGNDSDSDYGESGQNISD